MLDIIQIEYSKIQINMETLWKLGTILCRKLFGNSWKLQIKQSHTSKALTRFGLGNFMETSGNCQSFHFPPPPLGGWKLYGNIWVLVAKKP
jgi:hypothetical protein